MSHLDELRQKTPRQRQVVAATAAAVIVVLIFFIWASALFSRFASQIPSYEEAQRGIVVETIEEEESFLDGIRGSLASVRESVRTIGLFKNFGKPVEYKATDTEESSSN